MCIRDRSCLARSVCLPWTSSSTGMPATTRIRAAGGCARWWPRRSCAESSCGHEQASNARFAHCAQEWRVLPPWDGPYVRAPLSSAPWLRGRRDDGRRRQDLSIAHPGDDKRSAASPVRLYRRHRPPPFPVLGAGIPPWLPVACEEFGAFDLPTPQRPSSRGRRSLRAASQLVADTAPGLVHEPVSLT